MEASIVNPFIEGALYILDTTASLKARPVAPFLKKTSVAAGDISGVLEMTGDISGSVSITFTEKCILGIVSAMFGEEMTEMDEEITDAVGEIGNMISGRVTTKMTEMGKVVKIKLHEVKSGKGHTIEHTALEDDEDKKVLALPFETTKGNMIIEICY